ncbi:PfkB family carbohydrate kinase [Ferrimonas balearica]|uniref:PfkB family carbohydrate kinase n=1 Tax=Ferrimonas balearica TaxID=44012 RepID=UPI001C998BCD|nr:PfkB family carbohydrate kinase [Ferrimonas balearica]MBY5993359.1 ribokinase [Ferrimonas balearica]
MSRVLIIANLNCDHILRLNRPLSSGARIHYEDLGHRIGGGATNTGLGLVWAGHQVELVSQVGDDELGDWLLAEACSLGLNCDRVHRLAGPTQSLQLLMEPNGERTILRPNRPRLLLPQRIDWAPVDALYVNLSAEHLPRLMNEARPHSLVVAQLPKDLASRPCHYLITSQDDLAQHGLSPSFEWARGIAGDQLRAFIVTRGADGADAFTAEGQHHQAAVPAHMVDSTGAGDCYAAGLIHGLLSHGALPQAMNEAAQWAAFAVSAESSIPPVSLRRHLQSV